MKFQIISYNCYYNSFFDQSTHNYCYLFPNIHFFQILTIIDLFE